MFQEDDEGEWTPIDHEAIDIPIKPHMENITLKPRYRPKLSEEQRNARDDFIASNLARNIIVASNSNVLSPLVIVKKPENRGWRICVDYRQANVNSLLP